MFGVYQISGHGSKGSRVLGHRIGDEFIATLVDWSDLTSFESDVSAFRRNERCLHEFDCRLVVSEELRGCLA